MVQYGAWKRCGKGGAFRWILNNHKNHYYFNKLTTFTFLHNQGQFGFASPPALSLGNWRIFFLCYIDYSQTKTKWKWKKNVLFQKYKCWFCGQKDKAALLFWLIWLDVKKKKREKDTSYRCCLSRENGAFGYFLSLVVMFLFLLFKRKLCCPFGFFLYPHFL